MLSLKAQAHATSEKILKESLERALNSLKKLDEELYVLKDELVETSH